MTSIAPRKQEMIDKNSIKFWNRYNTKTLLIVLFTVSLLFLVVEWSEIQLMMKRPKMSEAAGNVPTIFTAQQERYQRTGKYCDTFACLKWAPETKNLYSYYLGRDKIESRKKPGDCPEPPRIPVTDTTYTAMAVGNLDHDKTCDVWYIDQDRNLGHKKMLSDGSIVEGSDLDREP